MKNIKERIKGLIATALVFAISRIPMQETSDLLALFVIDDFIFWAGLALAVIGSAVSVAGTIYNNTQEQEKVREQATQAIAETNYQRDTNLNTMEKQLAGSMENDYLGAQDLEASRNANSVASAQSSYMGQLAAEEQYASGLVQNARNSGELSLSMGASGAKEDLALATVINAEMTQNAAAQRGGIDKTRGLATFQRDTTNQASRTSQGRLEQKYDDGSAVRSLYNYQRERITGGAELETTYLQAAIDDNSDYMSWGNWWGSDSMWGDLLTAGSAVADIGKWAVGQGGFGSGSGTKASGSGSSLRLTPAQVR